MIKALGDKDPDVCKGAASVLKELKAVEPLIKALGDEDYSVCNHAEIALGEMGQRAVEPLIEALGDKDANVRGRAARALGEIGDEQLEEILRSMKPKAREEALTRMLVHEKLRDKVIKLAQELGYSIFHPDNSTFLLVKIPTK